MPRLVHFGGPAGCGVSAEFKDVLLTVHLPKDEKAKPKAIEVSIH
jgi:HSP20 family molecular chaperone IbpA